LTKRRHRAEEHRHDPQAVVGQMPALFAQEEPQTRQRRNLGTFASRTAAQRHERAVQYFKRH